MVALLPTHAWAEPASWCPDRLTSVPHWSTLTGHQYSSPNCTASLGSLCLARGEAAACWTGEDWSGLEAHAAQGAESAVRQLAARLCAGSRGCRHGSLITVSLLFIWLLSAGPGPRLWVLF